ncbi:MAG: two-component regulator propeller domain-containing protein [bacterium]
MIYPKLLLLWSCLAFPCLAQDSPAVNDLAPPILPRFDHITIEDGLSQGLIWAIHQDRRGFMWFGSKDGLNRYDGYNFKVFRHDAFDSTTISGNSVTAIFEDRAGRLWLGTQNSGLNCFDPGTGTFRRFAHEPGNPNSLSANFVTSICESPAVQGVAGKPATTLWIGTLKGGLNKLVVRANERVEGEVVNGLQGATTASDYHFTLYTHDNTKPGSLSDNIVRDVLVDRSGVLWVATDNGLNLLSPSASLRVNSIEESDAQGGTFTSYFHNPKDPHSLLSNKCNSLHEGQDGALWVATPRGLARLSLQDGPAGQFNNYPHTAGTAFDSGTPTNEICEAQDGQFWLATEAGLALFNPETATYRYIRKRVQDLSSLGLDVLLSVFQERGGVVWLGTNGLGLNKYDPKLQRFQKYTSDLITPDSNINFSLGPILQDRSRRVWFFRKSNLYKLELPTGICTKFPSPFGNDAVTGMLEDRSGDIWFTTQSGFAKYDNASGRIRHFFPKRTLSLQSIYEDREGSIWMAGDAELPSGQNLVSKKTSALLRWQPQTEILSVNPLATQETLGGFGLRILKMVRRGSDALWLASNRGLIRFDLESKAHKVYRHDPQNPASLNHNVLKTLLPDPLYPERFLWLGSDGGGLNRFEYSTETFTHYTDKDGLPNNVVYGILADDHGNLWMSTNKGIANAVLNRDERTVKRFRNYDQRDGLQSNEFNTRSYHKSANGEMIFGGIKGFNIFHPDSIQDNPHIPPVVFTDFQIRYQSAAFGEPGSPLQKHISATDAITLSYADNVFSFEFAALDYSAPEKNRYSFKLENFSKDWSKPGRERKAIYTNLNPGEYVFHVRGSNSDGVWNEEGVAIKITIAPPWWRTWWAYLTYFIVYAGIFYGIARFQINRQKLRYDLERKNLEADKLLDMDKIKSRFFANISHEFRTPLTLILGPAEELIAEASGEKNRKNAALVHRNAQRLLRLINQLLDLSRLETGKMQLQASPGDFVVFLKGLVMSFESLADGKNIDLGFQVDDAPQPCEGSETSTPLNPPLARGESKGGHKSMYFDRDKIEKIFTNLLSNAFKFTPDRGSVKVTCTLIKDCRWGASNSGNGQKYEIRDPKCEACINSPGATPSVNCVEIRVEDTGDGIPADRLPHIFDRFYQVDASSTRAHEGTGIGLALVKELVQVHNGSIEVKSREGRGTTLTVCLPLGKAHLQVDEIVEKNDVTVGAYRDAPLHADVPTARDALPNPTEILQEGEQKGEIDDIIVLIIEDNAYVRAYIREHLEPDYKIVEASDGQEGVDKAVEIIPDLVISDIMMPKKDGYQVCRQLKTDQRTSHIPIILLTAKAAAEEKIAGLETGADAYVLKPFRPKELAVRVRKLIELRRKLRERFSTATVIKPSEIAATSMDQEFLQRVITTIEALMEDSHLNVETLAKKVAMSSSQINRKLNALVGQPASRLIRSMRLQRAADLLAKNAGTMAEIAYQAGFSDQAHFTRSFQKQFGCTPSKFKKN